VVYILNISRNFSWQYCTEWYMHTFDRFCCTCIPLYIPPWWWPCRGQNM